MINVRKGLQKILKTRDTCKLRIGKSWQLWQVLSYQWIFLKSKEFWHLQKSVLMCIFLTFPFQIGLWKINCFFNLLLYQERKKKMKMTGMYIFKYSSTQKSPLPAALTKDNHILEFSSLHLSVAGSLHPAWMVHLVFSWRVRLLQ